jgi:phosphatidylglycerol:prolipoprotein diacylglycerol transferase
VTAPSFNWYGLLAIAGIAVTALLWTRIVDRRGSDATTSLFVYLAAMGGAAIGAKLAFLFAEGPRHWRAEPDWIALLTGRSVTGALLGGYVAVGFVKRLIGRTESTGDAFAIIAPVGIALGRVGCLLQGCCLGVACEPGWWTVRDAAGVARWPAVPLELLFNVAFVAWALVAQRRGWCRDNRFHVYLMAYGLFRLLHEPMRDIPKLELPRIGIIPVTGYQVLAIAMMVLGAVRFAQRARTAPRMEAAA